jgi:hypothetical protein
MVTKQIATATAIAAILALEVGWIAALGWAVRHLALFVL